MAVTEAYGFEYSFAVTKQNGVIVRWPYIIKLNQALQ